MVEVDAGTSGGTGDGTSPGTATPSGGADAPEWATRLGGQMDTVLERLDGAGEPEGETGDGEFAYTPEELAALYQEPGDIEGLAGLLGLDEEGEEEGEFDAEAGAQALQELITRQANEAAQAQIAPFMQQQREQEATAAAEALEEQYPELATPEVAERVLDESAQLASRMQRSMGWTKEQAEAVALDPAFNEQVYLAGKARERAAAEVAAGSSPMTTLETGGGVSPQDRSDEGEQAGDAIVNVSKNRVNFP